MMDNLGAGLLLVLNALLDGQRLEDIELRRNDEAFLDGLGAQRIPDPTTSGDFTRRFDEEAMVDLMEAINSTRQRVWKEQPRGFLSQAFIDPMARLRRRWESAKEALDFPTRGSGVMRP
jgi:hypothetical protein